MTTTAALKSAAIKAHVARMNAFRSGVAVENLPQGHVECGPVVVFAVQTGPVTTNRSNGFRCEFRVAGKRASEAVAAAALKEAGA